MKKQNVVIFVLAICVGGLLGYTVSGGFFEVSHNTQVGWAIFLAAIWGGVVGFFLGLGGPNNDPPLPKDRG